MQSVYKKKVLVLTTILISLLFVVLVVEGVVRARQWIKYGSPGELQAFTKDPQTHLRIPIAGSNTGRIQVNSLGFRSPELTVPKPPNSIRLAFLGGSTTWCAEVSGNKHTWPFLVWEELQKTYPDVTFDFLNAGVPGYSTKESLVTLKTRVAQLNPDIIVVYHATNDISYDSRSLAMQRGLYEGKPESDSWLGQWSLTWFLIEKNLQVMMRTRQAAQGESHLVLEKDQLSSDFRRRLRALVVASKAIAPLVAVATFSHQFRKEQNSKEQLDAANTAIYYMPYMNVKGLFQAFHEYNRVIRDVAQSSEIILIDKEHAIPGDRTHFNDSVHFTDQGSQAMAHRVVTALQEDSDFTFLIKQKTMLTAS